MTAPQLGGILPVKDPTTWQDFLAVLQWANTFKKYVDGLGSGAGVADPGANGIMVRTAPNVTVARTLLAGANIAIGFPDGVAGNPVISATAGSGEVNTASNVGTAGVGVFDGKVGVDLQFRKLNPLSSRITIALDAANQKIDFDVPGGSGAGVVGMPGMDGQDGDIGPPGVAGQAGAAGAPGAPGVAGAVGQAIFLPADDGLDGPYMPGPLGPQGDPGPSGLPGNAGAQGVAGPPVYLLAEAGDDGFMGPIGPAGPVGATGAGSFTLTVVEKDLTVAALTPPQSLRLYFHTDATLQGAPSAPAGCATMSEWPPDGLDASGQISGHLSTSSGVETSLLNKPATKDETGVAGSPPTTNPPAAAHQFGWFGDRKLTGTMSLAPWIFQWREDDTNAGIVGHPVINVYAGTTRDFASMRFLATLHGTTDWWLAATNAVNQWTSASVGPFTLAGEYLFIQLWCHETASFSAGQTLTFNTEGSDLDEASRSWILTAPLAQSGPIVPLYSGTFDIAGAGLTAGKPVLLQQAAGPYTGKGDQADEAEMDQLCCTGYVVNSTTIRAYWTCQPKCGPVSGNFKFQYAVSA